MKAKDVVQTAIDAGLSKYGKIKYRTGDTWEYNVGKWCGDHWSFDCLGFVHTIINGTVFNRNILGGGAVMDEFVTNTNETDTLQKYCYDQTGNFKKGMILPGELMYMPGHVGLYVGDIEPFNDGRIFNVAECCYSSFGGGGMLTYVSDQGLRYNHKNGSTAGYWTKHGKFYRVDYTEKSEPDTEVRKLLPSDILNIVNDTFIGVYGNNPGREQKLTDKYGYEVYRKVQDILNILYR